MKIAGWVTSAAVAFVAGWGIGRGGSSGRDAAVAVPPPAEAAKTPIARSEAKVHGRRLREGSQDKLLEDWDIDRISYLHSPEAIPGLDAGLYGEGERIDHATAFIWARLEKEDSMDNVMSLIPEEERSAVIGQLRGVTKPGQLAGYLRRQGTSEEEITRIVGEASKPWE